MWPTHVAGNGYDQGKAVVFLPLRVGNFRRAQNQLVQLGITLPFCMFINSHPHRGVDRWGMDSPE